MQYLALLILIECCTGNIFAADISRKVISLPLKENTLTEWQFHVPQTAAVTPTPPVPSLHNPFLGSLVLN
jgi:hypothetical protein